MDLTSVITFFQITMKDLSLLVDSSKSLTSRSLNSMAPNARSQQTTPSMTTAWSEGSSTVARLSAGAIKMKTAQNTPLPMTNGPQPSQ